MEKENNISFSKNIAGQVSGDLSDSSPIKPPKIILDKIYSNNWINKYFSN